MTDYKARQAAIDSDPVYVELEQLASAKREEASEAKAALVKLTYKLQRLLYLRDLALEQMWKQEDAADDVDATLKELTANSAECWCGMTSQAVEDLQDLLLDICAEAANLRERHAALELERATRWRSVFARADEIRKEWDAKEAAAEA